MPTIILDRDGVINHDSKHYIKSPEEWQAIDGSLVAIANLRTAGYKIAIATNQSGLGRGLFSQTTLHAIHKKMIQESSATGGGFDMIAFCPHHPDTNCECRKPKIGLLKAISTKLPLNPDTDWLVGDTSNDLKAAQRMGIRGALVETGKGKEELMKEVVSRETTPTFKNLAHFASWLLNIQI
ncbi:MAG TPA: D-glycero-beta-D-manno-heptose-1,7-bisphosphate 7-phosphatase [Gammaproteobacteria bacterium]|nr:D-glycero-beta-D-manno-heptose-1,7-bisphosphate 7-phosphatase [Gammaproteobacteria bacterium]HBX26268.1 D-glycero-beta-D-manno-heptose-1,7-bisphosphate 7-phosphatase [Gammaproteobacteria bacterium]